MTTHQILRWSGLAGLASAAAIIGFTLAFYAGVSDPTFVNTRQIVTLLLGQLGLIGLYAAQVERAGGLGLAGFLTAFAGMALNYGVKFTYGYIAPVLVGAHPQAAAAIGAGPYAAAEMVAMISYALGWALFGAATVRARIFPRWAGALMAIGSVLSFVLMGLPVGALMLQAGVAAACLQLARSAAADPAQPRQELAPPLTRAG